MSLVETRTQICTHIYISIFLQCVEVCCSVRNPYIVGLISDPHSAESVYTSIIEYRHVLVGARDVTLQHSTARVTVNASRLSRGCMHAYN